jgi:hypothetical protein
MSLPSFARHRWDLDEGGAIVYVDLGDAIIVGPGDSVALRRALLDAVTEGDWELARRGFGDDELISE